MSIWLHHPPVVLVIEKNKNYWDGSIKPNTIDGEMKPKDQVQHS